MHSRQDTHACTGCADQLQDADRLAISGRRLASARRALERAYGRDFTRLRALQGGSVIESATCLRLCVLEGLLARYKDQPATVRCACGIAQAHAEKLRVRLLHSFGSVGVNVHVHVQLARVPLQHWALGVDGCADANSHPPFF